MIALKLRILKLTLLTLLTLLATRVRINVLSFKFKSDSFKIKDFCQSVCVCESDLYPESLVPLGPAKNLLPPQNWIIYPRMCIFCFSTGHRKKMNSCAISIKKVSWVSFLVKETSFWIINYLFPNSFVRIGLFSMIMLSSI